MGIYKRDEVNPEWEPIPWDAKGPAADKQERGFHDRALKPLLWDKVNLHSFPAEGIFGHDKDWFSRNDVAYVTTFDGEDMILISNVWFGFPDPPEWGLASRPAEDVVVEWQRWGHFPRWPTAWAVRDIEPLPVRSKRWILSLFDLSIY